MALLVLGGCGAVPASNPSTLETGQTLPLLSALDIAEDTENVTLAAPVLGDAGAFLGRFLGSALAPEPRAEDATLGTDVPFILDDAEPAPSPQPGFFGRLLNFGGVTSEVATAPTLPPEFAPSGIAPGTMMAFGEIGPTCNLSRRERGTKIASASGYTVYDSIPNSTAPRPHYITGFADGCARQFTAALVMFGDVGTHELVRYARTRVELSYSATDNAYESIKTSFCRTGFGKPCGPRLESLAERTTFITAYERFGAGPIWAEFLLHDGAVAAADIEGD